MTGLDPEIARRICVIEADREHGAGFLAAQAVQILAEAAAATEERDWDGYLTRVVNGLAAAKPSMAAVRNQPMRLLADLRRLGPVHARVEARELADGLVWDLEEAGRRSALNAVELLPQDTVLLTCSYSSSVLRVCEAAQGSGAAKQVRVLEESEDASAPGNRLAQALAEMGLDASVVRPDSLNSAVTPSSVVVIGADAVTSTSVVNGTPSRALSEAVEGLVPVYVVCESIKFAGEVPIVDGYEQVPLSQIALVITESGKYTGSEASEKAVSAGR